MFCNVATDGVFQSVDVDTVYRLPLLLAKQGLDDKLAQLLNIWSRASQLSSWEHIVSRVTQPKRKVSIGFVGKYVQLAESYKSLNEALLHGGIANDCQVDIHHIDSELIEQQGATAQLSGYDGILVAPGFGARGTEGKVSAVRFAREQRLPFSASASACSWPPSSSPATSAVWSTPTRARSTATRRTLSST